MKNLFKILFLLFFVSTFTSCYDIIEEVWLERDGSMTIEYKLDLGKTINEDNAQMMVEMITKSVEGMVQKIATETGAEKPIEFSGSSNWTDDWKANSRPIDTLIRLGENGKFDIDSIEIALAKADSLGEMSTKERRKLARTLSHLAERTFVVFKIDPQQSIFQMGIRTKVNSLAELQDVKAQLIELSQKQASNGKPVPDFLVNTMYSQQKGKFNRAAIIPQANANTNEPPNPMNKMVNYISIYHFPGKVKKVSNSNSVISKNKKTVSTIVNMFDLETGNASLENEVRFKQR